MATTSTARHISYVRIPKDGKDGKDGTNGVDYMGIRFTPASPICVPVDESGNVNLDGASFKAMVVRGDEIQKGWQFEVSGSRYCDIAKRENGDGTVTVSITSLTAVSTQIQVTAYNSSGDEIYESMQVVKGTKGMNGTDALTLVADPVSLLVDCNADGTPKKSLSQYAVTVRVMCGSSAQGGWTASASGNNCTVTKSGSTANSATFALESMSGDTATITVTAAKAGEDSLSLRVPVVKVKDGGKGANGINGINGKDSIQMAFEPTVVLVECDSEGKPLQDDITVEVRIRRGGAIDSGWTIERTGATGLAFKYSEGIDNGTRYHFTMGVSAITGTASFKATKDGYDEVAGTVYFIKVKDGEKGIGAYIPPPKRWCEYDKDYVFQSGKVDDGETRIDVVLNNLQNEDGTFNAYMCHETHKKSEEGVAEKDMSDPDYNWLHGEKWWTFSDKKAFIATEVLLANNAYIKLQSGNQILIMDSLGQIVGNMSSVEGAPFINNIGLPLFIGGVYDAESQTFTSDPLFAVDTDGNSYHGGFGKQRIKIDVRNKQILFIDESSNITMAYTGRTLTTNDVIKDISTLDGSATPSGLNSGYNVQSFYQTVIPSSFGSIATKSPGNMQVTTPSFDLTVIPPYGQSQSLDYNVSAVIYAVAIQNGIEIGKTYVGSASFKCSFNGSSHQARINSATRTFNLPNAGTYSIGYRLEVASRETGGMNFGSVALSVLGSMSYHFIGVAYSAEIGNNGFQFSTDTDNYIYAIFNKSTGKLAFRVRANGITLLDSEDSNKHF